MTVSVCVSCILCRKVLSLDVLKNLHAVLKQGGRLTRADYQLLTLAFKTVIHIRRESYQSINRAEYKECGTSEEVSTLSCEFRAAEF